jgi:hypothetical protein
MAFRQNDFFSSETMRALEKVAYNKGLIKIDPLEKYASLPRKPNLVPSDNLLNNILNLCEGLRAEGLDSYAEEIEKYYMFYKKSSSLTDNSMIEQAHPEGSHTLEDVAGDAVIETIIDQQLKDIKMISKMPTGKLSNNQVMSMVKKALLKNAQEESISSSIKNNQTAAYSHKKQLKFYIDEANSIMNQVFGRTLTLKHTFHDNYQDISIALDSMTENNINIAQINNIISDLDDMINSLNLINWKDLGLFNPLTAPYSILRHVGDISDTITGDYQGLVRDQVAGYIDKALSLANAMKNILSNISTTTNESTPQITTETPKSTTQGNQKLPSIKQLRDKIYAVVSVYDNYISTISASLNSNPNGKSSAKQYLNTTLNYLKHVRQSFLSMINAIIVYLSTPNVDINDPIMPDNFYIFTSSSPLFSNITNYSAWQDIANNTHREVLNFYQQAEKAMAAFGPPSSTK